MVELIRKNMAQIQQLCQKHRIAKLWLFGSALKEEAFRADSDIDFLFTWDDGGSYNYDFPYVDAFLDLKRDLENLLKRKVDLLGYKKFRNPYFRQSVEETKKLIYEKKSRKISV